MIMEEWSERCNIVALKKEEGSHEPRGVGGLQTLEKTLEPPKDRSPAIALILVQ